MPHDIPLAAPGLAAEGTRPAKDAWQGPLRRWDGFFAVVVLVTVGVVLISGPLRPGLISAAALAALALWYAAAGHRAMTGDDQEELTGRAVVYLAGTFALLAVAAGFSQTAALVLVALCPQCFMALRFRRAVAAVAVIACAPLAADAVARAPGGQLAADAAIAALTLAFSIAFAGWITRIVEQSTERAQLIRRLEAAQAELASVHREAGVLAERQRLSAEIHDTIAQGMASIVMLLQVAEARLRADPDAASRHLELARDTARDNLAEARGLVEGLAPAGLRAGSLDEALVRAAALARSQDGLHADVSVGGTPRPLPVSAEVVLLRVCQEALANVRKHAGASRARVRLDYAEEEVGLEVTDDGRGFDPAAVPAGYGLSGMRTRVAEAGGALEVRSAPGAGTAITVRVRA
jgi:signal transduction histidine kinase